MASKISKAQKRKAKKRRRLERQKALQGRTCPAENLDSPGCAPTKWHPRYGKRDMTMGFGDPACVSAFLGVESASVPKPEPIDEKINEKIYPVPEIFQEQEGRGWKVRAAISPLVDFGEKIIYAPLDSKDESHCIRMHQIGIIKWDDPIFNTEGLETGLLYQAVNFNRINHLLSKAGVDLSAGFGLLPKDIEAIRPAFIAGLYTEYTKDAVSDFLSEEISQKIKESPTQATVVEIVKWLKTFVEDKAQKVCRKSRFPGIRLAKAAGAFEHSPMDYFSEAWEELDDDTKLEELPWQVRAELPNERHYEESVAANMLERGGGFNPWGPMTVEEPPRNMIANGKFHKRWKSAEEGVLPRYPHRLCSDQRVFARRVKLPGGTVVIDHSGSMSLNISQVASLLEHAPGCVVASYSGSGQFGRLRVLARDGRRVSDEHCSSPGGGGNIVDFPALKWAYKLSHPRIWVSDTCVTGVGDQGGGGNAAMCFAAVKKGRFFVAQNVNDGIKILKRLGRFYKKSS